MKRLCLLLVCCWFTIPLHALPLKSDAGGVTLEVPEEGKIEEGTSLSVSFPAAMVGTDKIDLAEQPPPLRFTPNLPGNWLWKSQTDGEWRVKGALPPGQTYAVTLAPGLRDEAGATVAPRGWGAELRTSPFKVEAEWEESEHLSALPGVVLRFSHPVRLDDVAKRIYFQDRDSGARQEAELSLRDEDRNEEPEAAVLRATPRAALAIGRTWDLIVEDVREQTSGNGLPYLRRVPLGVTAPLGLKWLAAFNLPLEKPLIRARFDDYLDPATVTRGSVTVDPSVSNLKVRSDGEDVLLDGDFDLSKHYQVTVNPMVKGRRGYGMAAASRWGATFRPKTSALFFPDSRLNERAALGLRFSFLQVHTGALRWRLAAVPLDKLAAVSKRTREFEQAKTNPFSDAPETDDLEIAIPQPTALLVDAFGLETRAEGTFPASPGETETLRDIRWTPPGGKGVASGAYLLEVDGPAWDGKRTVGHRSLVFFSESVITEKRTPNMVLARVAGMADGLPRPGLTVRAVSASNYEVARATTDRDGVARFAAADLTPPANQKGGEPALTLVVETPDGPAIATLDGEAFEDVYLPPKPTELPKGERVRAVLVTDRSLYRPGHTVRIKGFVRTTRADNSENGKLRVPAGQSVHWSISKSSESESAVQGDAELDEEGGWEAKWDIPSSAKLGDYHLSSSLKKDETPADEDDGGYNGGQGNGSAELHIQDYKVPLFEVAAAADPVAPPESNASVCKVHGGYFSGQPVVGARVSWRVHWERSDEGSVPQGGAREDDEFRFGDNEPLLSEYDQFSERAVTSPSELSMAESKGEVKTNEKGDVEIRTDLPPNLPGARYTARWEIAVTSADGQSVASSASPTQVLLRQPVLLGVAATTRIDDGPPLPPKTVRVLLAAYDAVDKPARAHDVKVELFRVGTKTVREDVAPFVVRYRNTPLYKSVKSATVAQVGPESFVDMGIGDPGRYVAVVSAQGLRPVSAEVFADGPGEDEVPVETPTTLQVLHPEKKDYAPGEKAVLVTRSPVSGVAWVSIETDRVLNTVLVPLPGSTTRIEFPVKPEYAPDATVAVYLLRPGGSDRLPAERFGSARLRVRRPDRLLEVRPTVEFARVRPGEKVRGSVRVASEGRAVAGADVTVWAVDDAILALGEWKAPNLATSFYPSTPHRVKTYAALRGYLMDISRKSLFQKGFMIGGGGEEFGARFVRKDFQPLAYWKTGLKTDAEGKVPVAFNAPDNLTRYRLVAVAQTRSGQFGEGEGSVEVAKPLLVEPSLPRFLRAGDEVELRAVVRQSTLDRANVAATCTADGGLTLDSAGATVAPVSVARDQPAVFRFRAKVADGPASVKITFRAGTQPSNPENSDATEITLPILPPTILRHESVAGNAPASGDTAALLPEDARRPGAMGRYDVTVSTSADLPRLQALPAVLEYPHGCFEQITSRVLAYCGVSELLAAVPTNAEQDGRYHRVVESALDRCKASLLPNDRLPYWASQSGGNSFVTIQAAWAVILAKDAKFEVDSDLGERLGRGLEKIAADPNEAPALRAFAFLVQSTAKEQLAASGDVEAKNSGDTDLPRTLFLHRENLGDEGRALLAVAMHRAGIMANEKRQLLKEILPIANGSKAVPERAFDAGTFGSTCRAEALLTWAFAEVRPPEWKPADAANARIRMAKILDRAQLNSTQENVWALFAYRSLRKAENSPKLRLSGLRPEPGRVSPDKTAAQWSALPLGGAAVPFSLPGNIAPSAATALQCVLAAEYRMASAEEDTRRDRGGLRVERVVRNLTDGKRTGRTGEPAVHLNDRLLVTYRLQTPKLRSYVALEDELPAGLETVNPDLPLFAPFYDLPASAANEHTAELSSAELHDNVTQAYFDRLDPGVSTYSVLARATAAGSFRWPATQAGPMYEPAVGGLAPSDQLFVSGE